MDVSRPYGFNTWFRAYDSPNVKEVSAGGLKTKATAQMRQSEIERNSFLLYTEDLGVFAVAVCRRQRESLALIWRSVALI